MEQFIKELETLGCVMIPGFYKESGDNIQDCQYFYFTRPKYKNIGFGCIGLVDNHYAALTFGSDIMPLGWTLQEDFIRDFKEAIEILNN